MRIYLTHCSKDKSPQAKASGEKLPPDLLYTDAGLQQFIATCKSAGVDWAILSDHYGVFSPGETHAYYEKSPASVTPEEETALCNQFDPAPGTTMTRSGFMCARLPFTRFTSASSCAQPLLNASIYSATLGK